MVDFHCRVRDASCPPVVTGDLKAFPPVDIGENFLEYCRLEGLVTGFVIVAP